MKCNRCIQVKYTTFALKSAVPGGKTSSKHNLHIISLYEIVMVTFLFSEVLTEKSFLLLEATLTSTETESTTTLFI